MLVDVREAGSAIKVSESFIRKLIKKNRLPFYRLSARTTRVDLVELKAYMRLVAENKKDSE